MLGDNQQTDEAISDDVLQGKVADVVYTHALESIPGKSTRYKGQQSGLSS